VSTRRAFLARGLAGVSALALGRPAAAQERQALVDTSNLFTMDQAAAQSVRLNPKPGSTPSMTPADRDALEHRIRCQCGCTLDVYTCRTTDFSCQVSPAMHRDIMALVQGGYTAPEILEAFTNVYGERALMAPTREGFNQLAYLLPGTAIAVGAVGLLLLMRRWQRHAAAQPVITPAVLDASPDEQRRIDAAVRDDA
jgi:cytochrome c-type biogenesis protein CcmH